MPPLDNISSDSKSAPGNSLQDAGTAAAANLEKTYETNGPAAAADKLRAEYLDSRQNPVKDSRNLTQLDYEMTKLRSDGEKGDMTLLECATDWGIHMLQNQGAIDQPSLEQIAATGQVGQGNDSSTADPYAQAMATELDGNWMALQGFAGKSTDPMAPPTITYLGLLESRDVDENIRTYKPAPPKPPGLLERIEGWL